MKYLLVVLGVFMGLMAITFVAETIEFLTIKFASSTPMEELQSGDGSKYFAFRNQTWILIFKIFYSLLGAFVGGYICAWISGALARIAILILIIVQVIAIIWAGFLSEMGATGPTWMWIYLMIILPIGIWLGFKART